MELGDRIRRKLSPMPPLPPMEFGDGVTLIGLDGKETVGRYLAGPRIENGEEVYWVCDWHAWDIATVREGRDPYGEAYPPDRVRRLG